jgi:hypothetical protein
MKCTVHFIITLLNVGNVLLCVIYQLNFTVFMYVTQISRSVLSAVSRNRGRPWNVLPVDTGAVLYLVSCVAVVSCLIASLHVC